MAAKKGQNLRVFVAGKCVAAEQSCTFHVGTATEETSSKDSEGNWKEEEVTQLNWDVQSDALVVATDDDGKGLVDILGMIGQTVALKFQETNGAQNRAEVSSGISKSGNAIVADISVNSQNKANVTYSVKFNGVGALT